MMLSDKAVQEFKDIYKKSYGEDISDAEAREQGERLVQLFDLLYKQANIEHKRKLRLKDEPDGFCLEENEGVYNCRVCYESVSGVNAWWDINGVKCLDCQRNIKEGVISGDICQNDKLWIKDWQLQNDYSLHSSTIRKMKREGVLHGRELKRENGTVYFTVYMVSENLDFLKGRAKDPKIKIKFVNSKK